MKKVASLEDLAFAASYREIVGNLLLCQDHPTKDWRLGWLNRSSVLSMFPLLNSQYLLKFIRQKLEYYLVGIMGEKIRPKYLQRFYEIINGSNNYDHIVPDIWMFFDCVLDDSIEELETHISYPEDSEPNSNLIPTIIKRSPLLKKLTINFQNIKKLKSGTVIEKLEHATLSLGSLGQLTSLILSNLECKSRSAIMTHLGMSSCPHLTHLSVNAFDLTKRDLLALILGELVDDIQLLQYPGDDEVGPDWLEDISRLASLRVPPEYVTSLCFTLQHLELNELDIRMDRDDSVETARVVAFLLCHLPSLKKFDGYADGLTDAIAFLYDSLMEEDPELQNQLERACGSCAEYSPLVIPSQPLFSDPYNLLILGFLTLTSLECVSLKCTDVSVLDKVGSLCPALKKVLFNEEKSDYHRPNLEQFSPENLESSLKNWPKLESITIEGMLPVFVQPILNAFGPTLKDLTFKSCRKIHLSYLASSCSSLDSLSFQQFCSLIREESSLLNSESFLPKLTNFESDVCLGSRSRFFEEKSTLTRLFLNCSHIGNDASHPLEWSNIAKNWPLMETLHIRQCTGLTMSMLSNFVLQLGRLKEIYLPDEITSHHEQRYYNEIIENISNRKPLIQIHFDKFAGTVKCRFPVNDPDEPATDRVSL